MDVRLSQSVQGVQAVGQMLDSVQGAIELEGVFKSASGEAAKPDEDRNKNREKKAAAKAASSARAGGDSSARSAKSSCSKRKWLDDKWQR